MALNQIWWGINLAPDINFTESEIQKYIEESPRAKSGYGQGILDFILGIDTQKSFIHKMKLAKTEHDKKKIIDQAIVALRKPAANRNDIIYALSSSGMDYAGYQLLNILNDKEVKSDKLEPVVLDCIICFANMKYLNAVKKISELVNNKRLKGAAMIALSVLGELDVEALIRSYIREPVNEIKTSYKIGFKRIRGDTHFAKQIRDELVETFTKVLTTKDDRLISTAIGNILALIKVDSKYYPFSLFTVIQELFGFKCQNQLKIGAQDQIKLLDIIYKVINENNRHRYYEFLVYVEKENVNIKETVRLKANTILNEMYPREYLGT